VYVILDQVERYVNTHGRFPRKMYVQIDGGAENANSTLVGWLQLLVAKQLIPEILLTRLPVGHTHEDIDALFGHIWAAYRLRPCLTMSDYVEVVRRCFDGNSKVEVDFDDVNVIPNYFEFLKPHNEKIARWAKEELTVHQVHIYAVQEDIASPLGYRLRYRDYCSDRVVLLKACSKIEAVTLIGQQTGLETITHHVKWFPDERNDLGVLGAGIFTLRRIPATDPDTGIPPINFHSKHIENLETTRSAIMNHGMFPSKSGKREEWDSWFKSVMPEERILSGLEYIKSHSYRQPLNDYLSNKKQARRQIAPKILNEIANEIASSSFTSVEWPEEVFSYSTPHVNFPDWKASVINPRVYKYQSENAQKIVKLFQDNTLKYYLRMEEKTSVNQLQGILRRRLNTQGKHEALNGNKEELIKRIAQGDFMRYSKIYGGVREKDKREILDFYWEESLMEPSFRIDKSSTVFKLVSSMKDQAESLNEAIFIKILDLFRSRDLLQQRANDTLYDVTETKNIGNAYKRSYFFEPEISTKVFVLEMSEENLMINIHNALIDRRTQRLYFPIRSMKSLVVISIQDKEFLYYNADNKSTVSMITIAGQEFFECFKTNVLCGMSDQASLDTWKIVCHKYCVKWERCGDIALLALMVHLMNDLPIYFEKENILSFRQMLAISIIDNSLYC
jgi:hypothetical protein